MDNLMFIYVLAVCVIVFLLFVIIALLFLKVNNMQKKLDIISRGADGQDILEKIDTFFGYIEEVKENYDSMLDLLKLHDKGIKNAYSKIHVHKYNPFKEIGGKFSWVLTVLDSNNNGYLINSIYHPDGTQIYCHEIKNGKTESKMSDDEMICVEAAINK